ncbi:MAG: hypothetical protein NTY61_00940 [Candidatus Parcubacteria bacterium]|nr:hypothetical protein [Candidatus Parcubacteria bacterium]
MVEAKKEINLREYAKYILKEGSTSDKERTDVLSKEPAGSGREEADTGKIVP